MTNALTSKEPWGGLRMLETGSGVQTGIRVSPGVVLVCHDDTCPRSRLPVTTSKLRRYNQCRHKCNQLNFLIQAKFWKQDQELGVGQQFGDTKKDRVVKEEDKQKFGRRCQCTLHSDTFLAVVSQECSQYVAVRVTHCCINNQSLGRCLLVSLTTSTSI